jgi:hypothetical protein
VKSQHDTEDALHWLFEDACNNIAYNNIACNNIAGKNVSDDFLKPLGALIIVGDIMAAQGNIVLGPA